MNEQQITAANLELAERINWPDNCFDARAAIGDAAILLDTRSSDYHSQKARRLRALSLIKIISPWHYPEAWLSMRCAVAVVHGDLTRARILLRQLQDQVPAEQVAA